MQSMRRGTAADRAVPGMRGKRPAEMRVLQQTDVSIHIHGGRIVPARIAGLSAEEPTSAAAAV